MAAMDADTLHSNSVLRQKSCFREKKVMNDKPTQ